MKKSTSSVVKGILYAVAIIGCVLAVIVVFSGDDQTNPTAEAYLQKQIAIRTPIGTTLATSFFEVTATDMARVDSAGKMLIIITATFKNTGAENRSITYGELLVNDGKKDMVFDQAQLVTAGKQPATPELLKSGKTTQLRIGYFIPAKLQGTLYWRPAGADRNQTIELGDF